MDIMDYKTEWSVNESLLQSYRSIFISSQAFILAVGVLLIDNKPIFLIVAIISLFMIWYIWFRVVRSRHLIVDYHKYASKLDKPKQEELRKRYTEDEYVKNKDKRSKANILLGIDTNWRPTRIKIDLLLPVLYTSIWLTLIFAGGHITLCFM